MDKEYIQLCAEIAYNDVIIESVLNEELFQQLNISERIKKLYESFLYWIKMFLNKIINFLKNKFREIKNILKENKKKREENQINKESFSLYNQLMEIVINNNTVDSLCNSTNSNIDIDDFFERFENIKDEIISKIDIANNINKDSFKVEKMDSTYGKIKNKEGNPIISGEYVFVKINGEKVKISMIRTKINKNKNIECTKDEIENNQSICEDKFAKIINIKEKIETVENDIKSRYKIETVKSNRNIKYFDFINKQIYNLKKVCLEYGSACVEIASNLSYMIINGNRDLEYFNN